jgi:hypothetical protein
MIFHRHNFEEEDRQFGWMSTSLKCSKCPKRKEILLQGHVHSKTPIPEAFTR